MTQTTPRLPEETQAWSDAIRFTLQWEGGYVNHPNDIGGRTNLGITQRTWNQYLMGKAGLPTDVANLTRPQAEAFYRDIFWTPTWRLFQDDPLTAIAFFDTAVMSGRFGATRLLQVGLGTNDDGIIGPITLSRITSCTDYARARILIMARRWWRLQNASQNPSQRVFVLGWQRRDDALAQLIDRRQFD